MALSIAHYLEKPAMYFEEPLKKVRIEILPFVIFFLIKVMKCLLLGLLGCCNRCSPKTTTNGFQFASAGLANRY
jgi:hypothetical protein